MKPSGGLRRIDLETWERREAYDLFRGFAYPYFGITADVDVTVLRRLPKAVCGSFSIGYYYLVARAANAVPEFRQRMRGNEVVEHAVVHPSVTIRGGGDQFRYCTLDYHTDFQVFREQAGERIEAAKTSETLWAEPDRDEFLYMTTIPWVSFTGLVHPVPLQAPDSVPRIACGKFLERDGRVHMPLNVQAHHALIDGIHVGRFYEAVQQNLDTADQLLASDS